MGRVELKEAKETVVSRLQRGNAVTVLYRVHFPTQSPLPRATSVQMNGRELCVVQNSGKYYGFPQENVCSYNKMLARKNGHCQQGQNSSSLSLYCTARISAMCGKVYIQINLFQMAHCELASDVT